MIADIHTHILPAIDDGAKNVKESISLLNTMRRQGITKVIATPHFYANESDNPVLDKTNVTKAYDKIKEFIQNGMRILCGFEVHYFSGISDCAQLSSLTIEEGKYMLLELPFYGIDDRVINEVADLHLNCGLNIILAHIERYCADPYFDDILSLIEDGFAYGQLNCDSLLSRRGRKIALNLINDGYVSLLATDTHSVSARPPKMDIALKEVEKRLGHEVKKALIGNADDLFCKIEGNL